MTKKVVQSHSFPIFKSLNEIMIVKLTVSFDGMNYFMVF